MIIKVFNNKDISTCYLTWLNHMREKTVSILVFYGWGD